MHRFFNLSCLPLVYLLLLAFLLCGHMSRVFRLYVLVHGLRFCVRGVSFVLLYLAYECVACFVLSKMDGYEHEYNYTTASSDLGFA